MPISPARSVGFCASNFSRTCCQVKAPWANRHCVRQPAPINPILIRDMTRSISPPRKLDRFPRPDATARRRREKSLNTWRTAFAKRRMPILLPAVLIRHALRARLFAARLTQGGSSRYHTIDRAILDGWCAAERRGELRIETGEIFFRRNLPVEND